MDPKWLFVQVVTQKGGNDKVDVMIGWIGVVSHHFAINFECH